MRITSKEKGGTIAYTIHLTGSEVTKICNASAPATALTSLVLAAADGGLSGPLIQAIAAAAVWRLKEKNEAYGNRGLRIKFKTAGVFGVVALANVGFAAATLRIKPPKE